jgi:hypothetical protein
MLSFSGTTNPKPFGLLNHFSRAFTAFSGETAPGAASSEYAEKLSAKNLQGACPLQSIDGIQHPVYNLGMTLLSTGT